MKSVSNVFIILFSLITIILSTITATHASQLQDYITKEDLENFQYINTEAYKYAERDMITVTYKTFFTNEEIRVYLDYFHEQEKMYHVIIGFMNDFPMESYKGEKIIVKRSSDTITYEWSDDTNYIVTIKIPNNSKYQEEYEELVDEYIKNIPPKLKEIKKLKCKDDTDCKIGQHCKYSTHDRSFCQGEPSTSTAKNNPGYQRTECINNEDCINPDCIEEGFWGYCYMRQCEYIIQEKCIDNDYVCPKNCNHKNDNDCDECTLHSECKDNNNETIDRCINHKKELEKECEQNNNNTKCSDYKELYKANSCSHQKCKDDDNKCPFSCTSQNDNDCTNECEKDSDCTNPCLEHKCTTSSNNTKTCSQIETIKGCPHNNTCIRVNTQFQDKFCTLNKELTNYQTIKELSINKTKEQEKLARQQAIQNQTNFIEKIKSYILNLF